MVDFLSQLQQLYQYIQVQENKIIQLENIVKKLTAEVETLKSKPPIHVDRIEYAFDQLKIEQLDGTLNIGLNPSDLGNIEDLAVNKGPTQAKQENQTVAAKKPLTERLLHYIDHDLSTVIKDAERQFKLPLNAEYHDFIKSDLKNQLEQRINYYLNQRDQTSQANDEDLINTVFQQIKDDIDHAVYTFIAKLPNNINGGPNNGT
ncbi:spore germination protein GerPC [Heyndrickxia ginsengihumi]|uniref:Spore gernimation protein n=1 Tax=Heyndrickxia ginsengihumi TaxID=363870 RepID=A0A0A6VCC4_9BACI|nr:spore germination protein GerPC [Heyndrickxia ginsengihumi]KHD85905.1 spore gernimation protein [Heyndrickxia ginsengihumi]MBE6184905.1 spore gernimation protein [Bacillus sp. (in: firmicutes)]MCM3023589.1 spore germination protein GerPC [Heyndrickxia ginsengihumi]NEY18854.1 spore gernimation protein [Heyndrickxia ginsengihumi]